MSPSAVSQSPVPLPSSQRCEPGSVNIPIARWPKTAADGPVDALAVATDVVSRLNSYLSKAPSKETAEGVASLFLDECYWRDHLALSWELRTLKTKGKIAAFLQDNSELTEISVDTSTEFRSPKVAPFNPGQTSTGILFCTTFTTRLGRGRGLVRLAEDNGSWKIWTLFTSLEELKGFEEPTGYRRPNGVEHGYHRGRKNWLDRRRDEEEFLNGDPDVLIIGAGQAGLTASARLKMLNVPTLMVDANNSVGDNWRKRYHQLVLHDPVWIDHLPYIPFPDWWPVFTPKDKLADFFESYARLLELNVWTRTAVEGGSWDEAARRWTVTLRRTPADGRTAETRVLHPRHIIQATGHSGKANLPSIPGMDSFRGDLLAHSSAFPGARPQHNEGADKKEEGEKEKEKEKKKEKKKQKKAVVIGACNSAHDICQDYFENGYDVTMVQRSSTCVVSSNACRVGLGGLYEEGGPPLDDADLVAWATPAELFKATHLELTKIAQEKDRETIEGLTRAGFVVDKGPDECGLIVKYYQRGGGYYIDVGASQLIVDGKIKVKHGQEVVEVLPQGLKFADGTELEADEIVFATGYQNMRTQARAIFGDAVAERLGDFWGFDERGEFRALCRGSGHPGFWFHGGNLHVCRYYSRLLALQIKAQLEGLA